MALSAEAGDREAARRPRQLVHVVILNWNGWLDTVECLESVAKSGSPDFCAVVVDNGSADGSCERIAAWARTAGPDGSPLRLVSYDRFVAERGGAPESERELGLLPGARKLVLVRCEENLGFAGGCNVGIRYALAAGGGYVWLLNNDTVVDGAALGASVAFLEAHPEYEGLTGQIRYHGEPGTIWNCGGRLTVTGSRRYHHADRPIAEVPPHGHRDITFITGCAPFLRASLFERVGLLSDRFFYGEEDYELSLRLKRRGLRLACLYDAVVYHKVGRSISVASGGRSLPMVYIFYLNRFIDLRRYWPEALWRLWRLAAFLYICPLVRVRHRASWGEVWRLRRALLRDSARLDRVSGETFQRAMGAEFAGDVLGR